MENLMRKMGRERFRSKNNNLKVKKQESKTPYGVALTKSSMPFLCKQIDKWCGSGAGYHRDVAALIQEIPTEILADLTCRVLLDCISVGQPLTASAMRLGAFLEEEARLRDLKLKHPDQWKVIEDSLNARVGFQYKKYSSRALTKRLNLHKEWEGWSRKNLCRTGLVFVDLFQKSTGLVELSTIIIGRFKKIHYLKPTSKALEWIDKYNEHHEDLAPIYLPSSEKAGYRSFSTCSFKVKNPEHLTLLDKTMMDHPYLALRRLQTTPWKVNQQVLETAQYFWDNQFTIANFPRSKMDAMPAKPDDINDNLESRKSWRKAAAKFYREDLQRRGERLRVSKTLWVASKFKDEAQLYFPHQFDFRGRAYAVPNFLNYQTTDLSRGMLEFGVAKPLGDKGALWFGKTGANLWGDIEGTVGVWIRRHEAEIHAVASDPTGNLWWSNADKPWQFLAWCLEASLWLKGELKESRLPIAIDASSNGLQIMSMLLRYREGAMATNCISRPKHPPNDIYMTVLKALKVQLESTSVGWDWLSLVLDRKLVKSIIMTIPYGCTQYRATDIICEWYWGCNSGLFEGRLRKSAGYLASTLISVFYNLYPKFKELMLYLEGMGKGMEAPLKWSSPSGYPVLQYYRKTKTKRVKSLLFGRIRAFNYNDETEEIDKAKMGRAFIPNFIHSLDAAVMHIAVARLKDVECVGAVHDCFATHAADVPQLLEVLRDANADVFGCDPVVFWEKIFSLKPLEKQALEDIVDDFSSMSGDLVIDEVRESEYMYR